MEIVIDIESTGLSVSDDRIVEIGAVEIDDHRRLTGRFFHRYVNPGIAIPEESRRIHGLTTQTMAKMQPFAEIGDDLLSFLADSSLVAHNAPFDIGFLDSECRRAGIPLVTETGGEVVDTLELAREKHPERKTHSLDALAKSYGIHQSDRGLHGALTDALLLQDVYARLCREQLDLEVDDRDERFVVEHRPISGQTERTPAFINL